MANWTDKTQPRVRGLDWPTYRKARAMDILEQVAEPVKPYSERKVGRPKWSGLDQGVDRGCKLS